MADKKRSLKELRSELSEVLKQASEIQKEIKSREREKRFKLRCCGRNVKKSDLLVYRSGGVEYLRDNDVVMYDSYGLFCEVCMESSSFTKKEEEEGHPKKMYWSCAAENRCEIITDYPNKTIIIGDRTDKKRVYHTDRKMDGEIPKEVLKIREKLKKEISKMNEKDLERKKMLHRWKEPYRDEKGLLCSLYG